MTSEIDERPPPPPPAPEEDPESELNVLRREVRQLQAEVRDTTMQLASSREEVVSLRGSLIAAEADIEDAISREGHLRMQLEVQRVKRERVESTLVAAEALVAALREMVLESDAAVSAAEAAAETYHVEQTPMMAAPPRRRDAAKDLDLLLSRISDASADPPNLRTERSLPAVPSLFRPSSLFTSLRRAATDVVDGVGDTHGVVPPPSPSLGSGQPVALELTPPAIPSTTPPSAVPATAGATAATADFTSAAAASTASTTSARSVNAASTSNTTTPAAGGASTTAAEPATVAESENKPQSEPKSEPNPVPPAGSAASKSPFEDIAKPAPQPRPTTPPALVRRHSTPVQSKGRSFDPTSLLRSAFGWGAPPPAAAATASEVVADAAPSSPNIANVASQPRPQQRQSAPNVLSSPSSRRAQSATAGTSVVPTRVVATVQEAHSGDMYTLASSADGRWLASGGDDRVVRIFDMATGAASSKIGDNVKAVTALAFADSVGDSGAGGSGGSSNEPPQLFAGFSDGSLRLFRKHGRRKMRWQVASVLPLHTQAVRRLRLATGPGGAPAVLSCSTDRTIKLADVEKSQRPFSVTAPSAVMDVGVLPDSTGLLVSGHKDGGVRVWSMDEQTSAVSGAKVHSKSIVSVSCMDNGVNVVTLGRDGVLRMLDLRNGVDVVVQMENSPESVKAVETVSDWHRACTVGRHVLCGTGGHGDVTAWNVDTGKLIRRASGRPSGDDADVLRMMATNLRNPGAVVVPLWTAGQRLVCAHRSRQVSFWETTPLSGWERSGVS